MPASYGGNLIFGRSVSVKSPINPSAKQKNEFFGVDGVESLGGGTRGRITEVTGVFEADTLEDLAAIEETLNSYDDNVARQLTDTRGFTFNNVVFVNSEPTSVIMQDSGTGAFYRSYRATFEHLTIF